MGSRKLASARGNRPQLISNPPAILAGCGIMVTNTAAGAAVRASMMILGFFGIGAMTYRRRGSAMVGSLVHLPSHDRFLQIGGLADTAALVQYSPSTDDFVLQINGFGAGDPTFNQVVYAQVSSGEHTILHDRPCGSVSVTPITSGVPEPSPWAMMILGFAAIGFFVHRRRMNGAVAV